MNQAVDRYAVMGNPISHSKSPAIHRLFAQQTNQSMDYTAILVELGGFSAAARLFASSGGKGLNVTVPFKQDAWAFVAVHSPRATRAGAVNVINFRSDGTVYGDNTDGVGLVRDLQRNLGAHVAGKTILLLGAGGAVRGVLEPLLDEKPARVVIANRTLEKAQELVEGFAMLGPLEVCRLDRLGELASVDLVINGTAASLQGQALALPGSLVRGAVCYDMMYGKAPTPFMAWGTANGARAVHDGLGMLVEQAAESFFIWRGVRPQTTTVIQRLRGAIESGSEIV